MSTTTTLVGSVVTVASNVVPGATITWSSLQPSIATVDSVTGVVTPVAAGLATIRATYLGLHTDTVVTVVGSAGPVTLVSDTFNRADNPASLGVADSGQTWNALRGTWSTLANTGRCAVANAGDNLAVIDSTKSDVTISVAFSTYADGNGIAFRCSGSADYLFADADAGRTTYVYKVVGGAFTFLGNSAALVSNPGSLQVITSGTSIIVKADGVQILSLTESFNQTATQHGLWTNGSVTASRFENLTVVG